MARSTGPRAAHSWPPGSVDERLAMQPVDLPNGTTIVAPNKAEAVHLYREIFVEGQYVAAGWQPPRTPVIVDVGANIGMFSLFALSTWAPARVVAIEAIPDVAAALTHNLAGFDNVTVLNLAAGTEKGTAEFGYYPRCTIMSGRHYDTDHDRAAVLSSAAQRAADLPTAVRVKLERDVRAIADEQFAEVLHRSVPVRRLDAVLAEHRVAHVDLLKIDVEGDELAVLRGLGAYAADVDAVIVEVDTWRVDWDETCAWLGANDFSFRELPRGPGDLPTMRMVFASRHDGRPRS